MMPATPTVHAIQPGSGLPWLTATGLVVTLGLWWLAGPAPAGLVFDREAAAQGEWWRWITGHLVHSGSQHALGDIVALGVIGWLMERHPTCQHTRLRIALAAIAGILAVNTCLMGWLSHLDRYCGLSGILNTLFVVLIADLWRQRPHPVLALLSLALALKLAAEMLTQNSLFLDMAWQSVPQAHIAGCLGGLAFLGADCLWSRIKKRASFHRSLNT